MRLTGLNMRIKVCSDPQSGTNIQCHLIFKQKYALKLRILLKWHIFVVSVN